MKTRLNNRQKIYLSFLESLKTPANGNLLEAVKQAYVLSECGNGCANGECDTLEEDLKPDFGEYPDSMDLGDPDIENEIKVGGFETRSAPYGDDWDNNPDGYVGEMDPESPEFDDFLRAHGAFKEDEEEEEEVNDFEAHVPEKYSMAGKSESDIDRMVDDVLRKANL